MILMNGGRADGHGLPRNNVGRPQRHGYIRGVHGAAEDDKGYVCDQMSNDKEKAEESLTGGEDLRYQVTAFTHSKGEP